MSEYVELHAHSAFSLLDGASMPETLVTRAVMLEMPALALTDHHGLYGAMQFVTAAREQGVHALIGAELTLEDGAHLVLLAQNRTGYGNLCWLISRAQLEGSKGYARLAYAHLYARHEGLIILTGCQEGPVARHLRWGGRGAARRALADLAALAGPDHLYVELQRHLLREDYQLVAGLAELADDLNLKTVVTNDVHYATPELQPLQDVLVALAHQVPVVEAQPWLRPNAEYYLKSAGEMAALFYDYPEALARTLEVAERCQVDLFFRNEALPPPPEGGEAGADLRLRSLCEQALPYKYPQNPAPASKQLAHELSVIRSTSLAGYFLTVWDIVREAQERGIQVRGRGSAANSLVAYLLGITNVDPLAHHLLFERFLSAEARTMPDIDLDFCARRREEIIQYLYNRYGEARVGMVCNYVTYQRRSAVRDVGKALGLPPATVEQLARRLRWPETRSVTEVAAELETAGLSPQLWQTFLTLCQQIQGLPRHLSIHVGGMIITATPLDELVPLERATMPGRVVVQWNKDSVEDAGLVKIDLLCLRTLSALDDCLSLVRTHHGVDIDLDRIPLDDKVVYDAICRADTIGAFQIESRAQQQALYKMRPRTLGDLVIEVALIRPGPLQGNMVHPYLRRRQGLEPVTHLHPLLAPVLSETLGVILFQEQVLQVAMVMGGFSAGEADRLRRAMSRHRSGEEMERFRERFVEGAAAKGVARSMAEEIFSRLSGFASYGFCKSHAAAFAKTAYDTMYLRAHYPAAYYCAVLNNEPMGYYAPRVIVADARRHGVRVLPVEVNHSEERCTLEGGAIRLGLSYVDGFAEVTVGRILSAREAGGPFHGLEDLARRTRLPRRLIEALILAGGLDRWGRDRRRTLWELGRLRYTEDSLDLAWAPDSVSLPPMELDEALQHEYGVTGVSAEHHLMELYREQLNQWGVLTSEIIETEPPGQMVRIGGMVAVRQRPPTAHGYVFVSLEDEFGMMNVVVEPDVFTSQQETWVTGLVLVVEGRLERASGQTNVRATRVRKLR